MKRPPKVLTRTKDFWQAHFFECEAAVALAVAAIIGIWAAQPDSKAVLAGVPRASLYSALAGIFGSLLGFVITAVSIVLAFSTHSRLKVIRESRQFTTLWEVFTDATYTLAFATGLALVGLIADREMTPSATALYFVVFGTLVASARLWRVIWALEHVIALVTAPSKARPGSTKGPVDGDHEPYA